MEGVSALQAKLVQSIQDSLAHFLISNAIFLAERLYAVEKSNYNLHVLATCFYRSGKPQKAYTLLKPSMHSPETRYLFSVCCYDLERYQEAESALLGSADDLFSLDLENVIPNGAAGLLLLGNIYRRRGQTSRAIHALRAAVKANPFLFEAFTILCQLGCNDNPSDYFGSLEDPTPEMEEDDFMTSIGDISRVPMPKMIGGDSSNSRTICSTPMLTPMMIRGVLHHVPSPSPSVTPFLSTLSKSTAFTITPNKSMCFTPIKAPYEAEIEHTPLNNPKKQAMGNRKSRKTNRGARAVLFTDDETPVAAAKDMAKKGSTRTPKSVQKAIKPDWTPMGDKEEPFTPISNAPFELPEITVISANALHDGGKQLLTLLGKIGIAFQHLCHFRCHEAITAFKELPDNQYETGWVLTNIGKAYLELAEYPAGKRIFEKVQQLEPYRVEGMEYFSTILWYLHLPVELSYLAHKLVEFDRTAPESWCATGNCFSLQNEHSSALKILKRAIQLDASFAYAYTLSGHEYIAIDDLEKAAVCFRNALQVDQRHYNAWYGLGMIYFRQEQLELAEFHFKKAASIHSGNSVLLYHISMVQYAQQRYMEALKTTKRAISLCETNNMAFFQQARTLAALELYEESFEVLVVLNERAPKQHQIFFALGRLSKILGNLDESARYLTIALDLDPQNSTIIKNALEKVDEEEDNEAIFDLS